MPVSLPDLPPRIARLKRDERGYPVPRFVEWLREGKPAASPSSPGAAPDFRYADFEFRARAFRTGLCWVCGEKMGSYLVYVIGPMSVINRTSLEPACHRDCAEFSAKACPFLIRPREKRNEKGLDPSVGAPGILFKRNPGCVCLYETNDARPFDDGKGGWLIRLGPPTRVDWWAEGRQATRDEILASIRSSYPLLLREAEKDNREGVHALERMHMAAMKYVPA